MRKIEQKMIDFLDAKLESFGAAKEAIAKKDARSLFLYAGLACVGIRESGGNNRGPLIELMQDTVSNIAREPWCLSFVQTCLAYAEIKTGLKSPLIATETCTHLWDKTPKTQKVKIAPLAGAIIIWQHGTSWRGHTGIVETFSGQTMRTIEGNTSGGAFNREGDGVYKNTRSTKASGNMRVLGFIKPF